MFRAAIFGEIEDVALDIIDHFRYGDGTDYSNEILTEKVKEHPSTQAFADQMLASLKEGLAMYNGDLTSIDKSLFDSKVLSLGDRPVFNRKPDDIFNGLTLTIDDTWANTVEVNDYYFDGENYSGTMKITIIDEFGLGLDDINDKKIFGNFEEFRAWFMLQHYEGFNGAYKPFNTVIELEYPFEGSIN